MRLNFCVDTPVRAELLYALNGVGSSQCSNQRPVTHQLGFSEWLYSA